MGSYVCSCNDGYIIDEDRRSCDGRQAIIIITISSTQYELAIWNPMYEYIRPEKAILDLSTYLECVMNVTLNYWLYKPRDNSL